MFDRAILARAIPDSFVKLDPRQMVRNPVMFVVEVGSVLTTILAIRDTDGFAALVAIWLWFTVLFANFAEAVAEGRGKAQADTLRKTRSETVAHVQLLTARWSTSPRASSRSATCASWRPARSSRATAR